MKNSFYLFKKALVAIILVVCGGFVTAQDYHVTVLSPSYPGIKWEVGTTQWISWVDNFDLGVNIYLMDSTGTVIKETIAEHWMESTFPWTVTSTVDTYKIKVASWKKPNLYSDLSDNSFKVVANLGDRLVLFQPNWYNIVWERLTTYKISWSDNLPGDVTIKLYDGNTFVQDIATVDHPNTTYDWTIPGTLTPSTTYNIVLQSVDQPALTTKGMNFSIVLNLNRSITIIQPNWYGIVWDKGTHMISWVDNLEGAVKIELLPAGTATPVYTIAPNVPHPTSYIPWDIAASGVSAGSYQIKITSLEFSDVSATGRAFTITNNFEKRIDIIQPNWTGIKWDLNKPHMISWIDNLEYEDTLHGAVSIYAIKTGGGTYTVTTHVQHPTSTVEWTPNVPTGKYRIQIVSDAFPGTVSKTSMEFDIVDVLDPVIVLQQPDVSGIKWLADNTTDYWISWVDNVPFPIQINLLKSGTYTGTYTLSRTLHTVPADGGTTWIYNIPLTDADNNAYFRIELKCVGCDVSTSDISQHPFQILTSLGGEIKIIQPDWTGIAWMCGSTQWISWTDNVAEPLLIDLLKWNGSTYAPILAIAGPGGASPAIPANESTYQWAIPGFGGVIDTEDFVYKIRITSTANPNIKKESTNPFKLYEPVDNIIVYPNPCNESFVLQLNAESNAQYTIKVYDRFGSVVRNVTTVNGDAMQATIPTADLPNGIYLVKATSGNKVISNKIIVQH